MEDSDFNTRRTPGRLEPTVFIERSPDSGTLKEVRGHGFVPKDLPAGLRANDLIVPVYDDLIEAERNLSMLEGFARRLRNPAMLLGPFAQKEARHSSAIENTFASEEQLALFELDNSTIKADQREEVLEVRNYLRALNYGFKDKRPICLNLIKEMHGILLKGSTRIAGRPGEFRTSQNAIGKPGSPFREAKFVPPPPRYLAQCLKSLEGFIHKKDDLPRLVKFALAHYQFECIHPFDDGNGRLGRILVALQLCRQGQLGLPLVYISGYLEKHRTQYYDLLYRVSTQGDWIDWARFFLKAVSRQSHDALLRAEELDALHTGYMEKVQTKRASAMLPRIIDHLFEQPAITVATATKIAEMRAPSAGNLIRRLEDLGILREATGRKSYRVYVAPGILEVMTRDLENEDQRSP